MIGKYSRRYAEWISTHSKLVIVLVLVATGIVAAGAAMGSPDDSGVGEFEVDSEEFDAQEFIQDNYGEDNTVGAQLVVRDEGGDVLTKESLVAGLELQEQIREDEEIAGTLSEPGAIGIENLVGTAAVFANTQGPPTEQPSVTEQRGALQALSEQELEALLERVLDPERDDPLPNDLDAYEFLPRTYQPGSTSAQARLTFISQTDDSLGDESKAEPVDAYAAQVEIDSLVDEQFEDAFVFGQGVRNEASSNATGDSFAIITPFALVLILFVLGVSYRDVTDIVLAILGIVIVMVWLQGIMGWLQIPMNVILIAVPFLLIGLSIDYAVHVVMRYREARSGSLSDDLATDGGDGDPDSTATDLQADATTADSPANAIRAAMALGFGSVVLALAAATFSTGVGFLSNVVSPLPAIQDFAIMSSGGIFATFVAFAVFLPALKIEVDSLLESRLGWSRDKPAFGASTGGTNTILSGIASLTSRAPLVILLVALLLSLGGAYGGSTIDTEFNQADFLPSDAPDWAEYLPGPLEPGTYTISEDFEYLSQNFQLRGEGGQSTVLLREAGVTSPAMLTAVDDAANDVDGTNSIQLRPDNTGAVEGPHTAIREVAAANETFAAVVEEADSDGDMLPEENVEAVYLELFAADQETASSVLSRDGDQITSARLTLSVQSDASAQTIASDTRGFADTVEANAGDSQLSAVATGGTVTTAVLQDALLETLVEAFVITLVVISVFLTVLFWVRYRSPTQGIIVVIPVVIALAWLLGTMSLLGIPFNSETAVITSLAIGLGVDYSIHAGERFVAELDQRETLEEALDATITGTGGALLASAATTASGFGVLALSLSPPLRRFGLVTGAAIVFAFVSVMTVLPCLLVVRERLSERFFSEGA